MEILRYTDEDTGFRVYELKRDDGTSIRRPAVNTITSIIVPPHLKKWFQNTSPDEQKERLTAGQNKGTIIHEIAQQMGEGKDMPVLPEFEPVKKALQAFHGDLKTEVSERYVFSEKYGYGGTLDRIGEFEGKRYVIDFKSGSYSNMDLWKTEAYRRASIEMGEGSELGTMVVYFNKNGKPFANGKFYRKYTVEHHDSCFKSFLMSLYLWKMLLFNDLLRAGFEKEWLVEDPVENFYLTK
jgi:hypothetical protein